MYYAKYQAGPSLIVEEKSELGFSPQNERGRNASQYPIKIEKVDSQVSLVN